MKRNTMMGILALSAAAAVASADSFSLSLNQHFGENATQGTIGAVFQQVDAHNVTLTLTAVNFAATEAVDQFYFNFDASLDINLLSATSTAAEWVSSTVGPQDFAQADGDGKYDVWSIFQNPAALRFGQGDVVVINISTAIADYTIDASSFFHLSAAGGDAAGPFYAAAHVIGVGADGEGSDWLGASVVPLPTAAWAALVGLGFVGFSHWKRGRAS